MSRFTNFSAALLLAVVAASGFAGVASAQATRTWVSGGSDGDDVNPCSRLAPCKTFAGAISKTATDGVIEVLSPGGFGSVTITKGITIRAVGAAGAITGASSNGVTVNAPGARVQLVGLAIDGVATGLTGVRVQAASAVTLENCLISSFRAPSSGVGVLVAAAAATRVTIRNSSISANLVGVDVAAPGNPVNQVSLDNVLLDGNATANIRGAGARSRVTISSSTSINAPIMLTGNARLSSYGNNVIGGGGDGPTEALSLN